MIIITHQLSLSDLRVRSDVTEEQLVGLFSEVGPVQEFV
jgi:hypothetical protein